MGLFDIFKKKVLVSYIMTQDGNIAIVNDGKASQVSPSHPNYTRIVDALQSGQTATIDDLLDVPAAIARAFANVTVDPCGRVLYKGEEVGGVIASRILEFMFAGQDFAPLAMFFSNLMDNPSKRAIDELYGFLENEGMPITDDGCFIAYKGIQEDWLDVYSKSVSNVPGSTIEMPRQEVDDDPTRTCSYGYHVGSHSYACSWACQGGRIGRVVLVKVNPKDTVSVPKEHNADKLRVCKYEVMEEADRPDTGGWSLLEGPVFAIDSDDEPDEDPYDEDEEPDEDFDWCGGHAQPALYFDEGMKRWRDRTLGGKIISQTEANARGYYR